MSAVRRDDPGQAATEPIAPNHAVLLIRLARYDAGMSDEELYEATRRWWRIGPRREHVDFVFALHGGVVVACYDVEGWEPAPDTPSGTQPRWGFWGSRADNLERQYLGVDMRAYLPAGAQNPLRYVNVPTGR